MITKEDLKQEIDSGYLELVFNLLKQYPHQSKPDIELKTVDSSDFF